jgi:hypothetical protein
LSVATLPDLLKGGKNGAAVVAGHPESSEIIKRVTLDPDHKEFMPSDGKTPLTKNEIAIIKWWIKNGQAAPGKTLASINNFAGIKPMVAAYLGLPGGEAAESESIIANQKINPNIPAFADTVLINDLRKNGVAVRYLFKKPIMLDMTFQGISGVNLAKVKPQLLKLSKNIIWLNFSESDINASDLDFLRSCTNLEKLRLDKTPVTDDIKNHLSSLKHLKAVNLSQTQITAQTVDVLKANPSIKRIYIWGSNARASSDDVVIN